MPGRKKETAVESISKEDKSLEKMTLEQAFDALEDNIEQLEDENISLENSFQIYNQGMKLLKYCNDKIDKVEKKVLVLNEKGELDEF